ncbi:hypothetical protein H4582DRAFT_99603 [Lactarius indigo]|nr:hypothetical protein H4582DRAFT_99603 [Lactarius indigo]
MRYPTTWSHSFGYSQTWSQSARLPGNCQNMQNVFDQDDDLNDDGIIRGGAQENLIFCQPGPLGPTIVRGIVQTPCKDIIEEFRSLFNNLYFHVEPIVDTITLDAIGQSDIRSLKDRDEQVQDALKKLQSSEVVLSINKHLASSWNVDDGCSLYEDEFRPDPAASRKRRKRKAEDDGGINFNDRRRGRFPPSSSSTQPVAIEGYARASGTSIFIRIG